MFNTELFIKIRFYLVIGFLILSAPLFIILSTVYSVFNLIIKCKKFKNIEGDIAVITGSGHGLGRSIALELAKRGCNIALADINLDGVKETEKIIKSKYAVKVKGYKVDVSDYNQVLELNEKIKNELGLATILVNNAGLVTLSNFVKPKPSEIQRMINVNLVAHFFTNEIFLENMKLARKGHIVAICSIAGMFPLIYNSPYVSSKFGVRGMMRSLRLDLSNYTDIHTTIACPSFLQTNDTVVDISKEVSFGKYYPLINGEDAAYSIVCAMLRNEAEITLPRIFALLSKIFDAFPPPAQDLLYKILGNSLVKSFEKIYKEQEEIIKKESKSVLK